MIMTVLMQNTLVVLVLGLTVVGQVQTGAISGGREADPHSRPYMVLLELQVKWNETSYCDGFLVSDEFVLTAAHCHALIYYVHVGKFSNLHQTHKGIEVSRAIPHHDYNESQKTNDLMLLKLSRKIQLTTHVSQIKLAGQGDSLPQHCVVYSNRKQRMDSKLREMHAMNVTIVDSDHCAKRHVYCAIEEEGSYGYSGGPLVCDDLAFGVASFNTNEAPIVNVFGKIPNYLDWIESRLTKK